MSALQDAKVAAEVDRMSPSTQSMSDGAWAQTEREEGVSRGVDQDGTPTRDIPTGEYVGTAEGEMRRILKMRESQDNESQEQPIGIDPDVNKENKAKPKAKAKPEKPVFDSGEMIHESPLLGEQAKVHQELDQMAGHEEADEAESEEPEIDPNDQAFMDSLNLDDSEEEKDDPLADEREALEVERQRLNAAAELLERDPIRALNAMGIRNVQLVDNPQSQTPQAQPQPQMELPEDTDPVVKQMWANQQLLQQQNKALVDALTKMQNDSYEQQQQAMRHRMELDQREAMNKARKHVESVIKKTPMLRERGNDILDIVLSKVDLSKLPNTTRGRNKAVMELYKQEVKARFGEMKNKDAVRKLAKKESPPMPTGRGRTLSPSGKGGQSKANGHTTRIPRPADYEDEDFRKAEALAWLNERASSF